MLSRICFFACLLFAVCCIVGCGGRSSDDQEEEVVEEGADDSGESGIPGLTVADVAAQPEAPELPSHFDSETRREEVEEAAARQAEREEDRGILADTSVEKRTAYLGHVWWQGVNTLRRGQPSKIEGLTVGEVEDQPTPRSLPEVFDQRHGKKDLEAHAWNVAMEERDQGLLGDLDIEARVTYLTWFWQKPLAERQAIINEALATRKARSEYEIKEAKRFGDFKRSTEELERRYDRKIELEQMRHNPVLTPRQSWRLDEMVRQGH